MKALSFFMFFFILFSCTFQKQDESSSQDNRNDSLIAEIQRKVVDTIQSDFGLLYEVKEYYNNGSLKRNYFLDEEYRYHTDYFEYYKDGTKKVSAKLFEGHKAGAQEYFRQDGTLEVAEDFVLLQMNASKTAFATVKNGQVVYDTAGNIIDSLTRDYASKYIQSEDSGAKVDSVYLRFNIMKTETDTTRYFLCIGDIEFGFFNFLSRVDTCFEIDTDQIVRCSNPDSTIDRFHGVLLGLPKNKSVLDTTRTFITVFPR